MRRLSLVLLAAVVACSEDSGPDHEIGFEIVQRTDPATGETTTSATYELLRFAGRGRSVEGAVQDDFACTVEQLRKRVGRPRGDGTAVFAGGRLPPGGLRVHAGEEGPTFPSAAFARRETLSFEAQGFGMPRVPRVTMTSPSTELVVTSPAHDGELAIDGDFFVTWEPLPADDNRRSVVVALETDDEHGRSLLRCFYRPQRGRALVPREWLHRLEKIAPASRTFARGKLTVGSYRQEHVFAGEWWIYLTMTSIHHEQPFRIHRR